MNKKELKRASAGLLNVRFTPSYNRKRTLGRNYKYAVDKNGKTVKNWITYNS